jgi:SMODS and SLOG-associating 2TM effector domain 1
MTGRDSAFQALYQELRIEDQKKYYDDRCKEYEAAHRQAVVVRNTLLLLAALASIAGQFTGPMVRGTLAVAAAVLGALAVAVTGFEALIGFPQLTKLYTDAARNLAVAEIDWTTRAPDADLGSDVNRVEEIFTREVGQWGQLVSEAAAEAARTAEGVAVQGQPTADQPEPPAAGGR